MVSRAIIMVAAVIAILAGGAWPLRAHHGWSGYDNTQVLNLTGVIRESGYEHPHAYITLDVPGKTWLVVLAPPSRMERRGIPRDVMVAGKTVTIVGYPHRSTPDEMRAERITIDGKTAELR